MKRLEIIRKAIKTCTNNDSLTNGLVLEMQLKYITNEYIKLGRTYSFDKLKEEFDETIECLSALHDLVDNHYSKNELEYINNLNNNIEEFRAKLLGLFLEISDLILVISYLDSVEKTNYRTTYMNTLLEKLTQFDERISIDKFKISKILQRGTVSILTEVLEYKVKELYIAKKLGNGDSLNRKYDQYALIFHTLYPNKKLIDEDNYKMIRKWIFVNHFEYLMSSMTLVVK